ncbi:hypothetical protein HMSSN036_79250 [Paenibacillus macerans]|nr:hypothetical protein HMSSN036_79250 [Paenibacillus macerans]
MAAAKTAKEHGAHTIGLTHNKEAALLKHSDHTFLYEWGEDSDVKNNPMAIILELVVEILNTVEGYAHYDAFQSGMQKINGIIVAGKRQVAPRAKTLRTNTARRICSTFCPAALPTGMLTASPSAP